MKSWFLLVTAALLCLSSMHASSNGYEKRAFEGKYGLWSGVRCVSNSVRVIAEFDAALMKKYSVEEIEADVQSDLANLAFPAVCKPGVVPAPATMALVELEIRTVVDDDGSLVYFVRLLADLPDGAFAKTSLNQLTSWESHGKLGHANPDRSRDMLRKAMSEQVEEFATFMSRARTLSRS